MLTNRKYSGRRPLVVGAALLSLMVLLPLAGCKNDSVPEPTRCTVTFNANGGTGNTAPQSFAAGAAQKLAGNGFSRAGCGFAGWAESAGGAVRYTDGQEITVTADTTLYARWQVVGSNADVQAVVVAADGTRTEDASLAAACAAAAGSQGSTVYPVRDITVEATLDFPGGTVTLDLNGRKVSSGISWLLNIAPSATVTVTDSSGLSGSLACDDTDVVVNNGILTVSGGSLTSGTVAVHNNGTLTVNGGSISSNDAYGVANSGSMTVNGGSISSDNNSGVLNSGSMTVNGGAISSRKRDGVWNQPAGSLTVCGGTISSGSTYAAVYNAGTLTVSGGTMTAAGEAPGINLSTPGATLRLSGNPAISGSGAAPSGAPFASIWLEAADQALITGPLTMEGRLTVDCSTSIFQSGPSFSAFKGGEGYTITEGDLAKLVPVLAELPPSDTLPAGGTISVNLDTGANAIVVSLTPRQ